MKNKYLRTAALMLCALMLSLTFTACSASRPIKGTDEELAVVGKVGSFDVLYEELRYVTKNYKEQMKQAYGSTIWDSEESAAKYRDELTKNVLTNITANYAVLELCAEVGISIDATEIQSAVSDYIAETITELGGRSSYKKSLEKYYLTDHLFRFSTGVDYCQNELYYVYVDDLALIEKDEEKIYNYIMEGNFVRTVHVYIQNDDGDVVEENRKKAEDVREKLLAGTSINSIIGSSVNEDFNLTTTNGYYFTRGEMVEAYEDAAFGLEIGGISEVIETYSGFYVIQRLELEPEYVLANLKTLVTNYQYSKLNEYIVEKQSTLTIELNDYGKSIDLTAIN